MSTHDQTLVRRAVAPAAFSYLRTGLVALCALMLSPMLTLAFGPLLLVLLPVALVVLPFMLIGFCSGAGDAHMETRRIDYWHSRVAGSSLAKARESARNMQVTTPVSYSPARA